MIKSKIALLGGTGFVGQNVAEVFTDNQLNFDIISKSKGYDLRDTVQVSEALFQGQNQTLLSIVLHM